MAGKIIVIGDVMLDKYDYCRNRDNPESSAPCYFVERTEYKPGGAGNVAANLAKLGSNLELISVIGEDSSSRDLINTLDRFLIPHSLIIDPNRPTIVKERTLSDSDGRYHYRKDREKKQYINLNHVSEVISKINNPSRIIISDYNKGMISERLMEELRKTNIPLIIDPKPNHKKFYYNSAFITPNSKEACEMSDLENDLEAAEKLIEELNTNVLLTRSERGVSYFGTNGERINFPTEAKEVFDVTGAGDTVIATFAHLLNKDYSLKEAIRLANKAAGISVGHVGCYQVSEKELGIA
jgi:D-beta-D-heptose 7-phosphate kinase/D-beta-D-heptose 1-phosphate adenosyltransferase